MQPISHWPLPLTVSPPYCHQSYFYKTLRKAFQCLHCCLHSTVCLNLFYSTHLLSKTKCILILSSATVAFLSRCWTNDLLYLDNSSSYVKMTIFMINYPPLISDCHPCPAPWPSSPLSTAPPLRFIETTEEGKCYFFSTGKKKVIILGFLVVPSEVQMKKISAVKN